MNQEDGSGNVRLERQVRRFDCISDPVTDHPTMEETELGGDWVKWDEVKPLLERLRELEEKVKRMKSENGYPTFEDMLLAADRERRRLVPIVYEWAFPNSKPGMHEEDMAELAKAMGVKGNWNRERSHLIEAMKLMRESGADKREYVVYATLSAGLEVRV